MVIRALRPYRKLELAGLFLLAFVVSMVLITIANNHQHDRIAADARASCLKDQRIAENQRRVILAVLALARAEYSEGGEHPIEVERVKQALANVPEFNCK